MKKLMSGAVLGLVLSVSVGVNVGASACCGDYSLYHYQLGGSHEEGCDCYRCEVVLDDCECGNQVWNCICEYEEGYTSECECDCDICSGGICETCEESLNECDGHEVEESQDPEVEETVSVFESFNKAIEKVETVFSVETRIVLQERRLEMM